MTLVRRHAGGLTAGDVAVMSGATSRERRYTARSVTRLAIRSGSAGQSGLRR
jgi:hypothetical protein